MQTTAVRDGDYYILNGEKTWISLADVADHFIVFAYTDKSKKHHGISAFIVERSFEGFSSKPIKGKLGIRSGNTGSLFFDNMKVPKENLLGEEGEGFKIAMSALDNGRFTVAAGAVGQIMACLEASVKYCHERETFGKPIGKHQLVQQMIANMEAGFQMSRLLVYRAGELKNKAKDVQGKCPWPNGRHATLPTKLLTMPFKFMGLWISDEYPVERYLRNSKAPVIMKAQGNTTQLCKPNMF